MKLKTTIENSQNYIGRAVKNGFFHIIGASTIVKLIPALSSILLPRILGNSAYASIGFAENVMTYLLLLNGLGISNAILRYCAVFDSPEEKKSYFNFAVKFGLIVDAIVIAFVGVVMFGLGQFHIFTMKYGSGYILLSLAFILIFQFLFDCIQYYLRANRANKSYSRTSAVFTVAYGISQVALGFLFTTKGIIIGRYIAYVLTLIIAYGVLKKLPVFQAKSHPIPRAEKKGMLKYSFNILLSNAFSLIMPINEMFVLGWMVVKSDFADYKAATVVPASLQFITMSVIVYVFPYFAKNYKDGKYIMRNAKKLFWGLSAFMTVVTIAGFFLSPEIVKIFGKSYESGNATMIMRILFVTFGINSALRMPVGNILAAIGEVRFNLINAIFSSTVHLAICVLLISHYGIYGAAYGLLSVYALASVAGIFYLRYYCKELERKHALSNRALDTLPDEQIEEIEP